MLTVAYVGHSAKLSGGEIALLRLVTGLGTAVDPLVVLAEDGPLVATLRGAGVEVVVLPMAAASRELRKERLASPLVAAAQLGAVLRYSLRLRRLLLQRGVDVVHTNTLKAGFYGCLAARLAGIPSVWHVRDRLAADYLPQAAVLATQLALSVLPHRILCNSRETARTVLAGPLARRRRQRVEPPLHDPLDVASLPARSPRPPHDPGGPLRIGMVGRLAPWKGQHLAVQALAQLDAESTLVLIGSAMFGETDYETELHREVSRLGLEDRVEFRGFVGDVFGALAELDVLVHASTIPEPFGQVVVEGLAAGVPMVAARGGGPGEIITDGVDGLLYDAGDVPALTALLRRVQAEPELAEALTTRGQRRAEDFASDRIAPSVLALYECMVGGH